MRLVESIQALWDQGGPFIGDNRACVRVTVEKSYWLNSAMANASQGSRGPFRYFKNADPDFQVETEIPNVMAVETDRSIDNDAGTCRITIANTKSLTYGEPEEAEGVWGKPGYFSFSRGESQEAKARWGQSPNEWSRVLTVNALIRTYHGYGGWDKTIEEALEDGNIVQTGCWLVDTINLNANGDLILNCRDMNKLLIDQQLYPPLMPRRLYPLDYYRWEYTNTAIPPGELPVGGVDPIGLPCHYGCDFGGSASSSSDATRSFNAEVFGHYPSDAFDSSPEPEGLGPGQYAHQATFWLSNGHTAANGADCYEWIEICADGQNTNKVYIHPYGGDYECFISVWENGDWVYPEDSGQGGIIPYSGVEYTGVNAADIPYVCKVGVKWEAFDRQAEHLLPRVYRADKIRLTFTNLTETQWGAPNNFRAGVRKTFPMYDRKAALGGSYLKTFTCFPYPKVDSDAVGYWQVRQNGDVFAFGDARVQLANGTNLHTDHGDQWVVSGCATPTGNGYWTLDMNGRVVAYGDAVWYGDRDGQSGFTGIAPSPSGEGYWLLHRSGYVYDYGDATNEGNSSHVGSLPNGSPAVAHAIESHPTDDGFWVLWTDGFVDNLGTLPHYGDADRYLFLDTEYVAALRRTSTGDGYWIVSGSGWVKAFGDAVNYGSAVRWPIEKWGDAIIWDFLPYWNNDGGYALQHANGALDPFGDFEMMGSVAEGVATSRKDGNYCVDQTTEIFTKRGWLSFDQVVVGDETLSIDPLTEMASWDRIEAVNMFEVEDEEMVRFCGQAHDSLTTQNHKWLVKNQSQNWKFMESGSMKSGNSIPLAAPVAHGEIEKVLSDEFVEMMAWFWTEGCVDGSRISFSQSLKTNSEMVERIDHCMIQLYGLPGEIAQQDPDRILHAKEMNERGYSLSEIRKTVGVSDNRIVKAWIDTNKLANYNRSVQKNEVVAWRLSSRFCEDFVKYLTGDYHEKIIGVEFFHLLTPDQLDLFLDVSMWADGHSRSNESGLTQKSLQRSSSFQYACTLAGRATKLSHLVLNGEVVGHRVGMLKVPRADLKQRESRENYTGIVWCPTTSRHNWLARRNGTVFYTGNSDYSGIVKELAMWSGYLYYDTENVSDEPEIFGLVENTGAYSPDPLPKEMFDKRPVIDAITEIKEIVGFILYCDQEGGFRFVSPNWWALGNYDYYGTEIDYIPVIDEKVNLYEYGVESGDNVLRSELTISTAEPTADFSDTLSTTIVPQGAEKLRGMVKPAQWINGMFLKKNEQIVMAELISMHMWFSQRMGSVRCQGNPLIDINDQVRIFERTTGETAVHYVRGVSTKWDIKGEYTMELQTNWLGGSPLNLHPYFMACAPMPDGSGYWQCRNDGSVYAFGDAQLYSNDEVHRDWVLAMRSTLTGEGYYTMDVTGKILAYGDAVHYGDYVSSENDIVDFALTPTGEGYWMLKADGTVINFGDATNYGGDVLVGQTMPNGLPVSCRSIESHPTDDGYWIIHTDGLVVPFGDLTNLGDADTDGFRLDEYCTRIRRTLSGDGYWIVSGSGKVQAFGDATDEGEPDPYPNNFWADGLVWDFLPNYNGGDGYSLQHAEGKLDSFGDFNEEGDALGKGDPIDIEWALVPADDDNEHFSVSGEVMTFLSGTDSPSAQKAVQSGLRAYETPTSVA